jgi:predicted outer membrane repeat protein
MPRFFQRLPAVALAVVCGLFAIILLFAMTFPARSASLAPSAETVVGCDPNDLIDAIDAANAGASADTLSLAPSCTYTLTSFDNNTDGRNGLPSITTEITVEGNGASIVRSPSAVHSFRLFHVAASGRLSIEDLTLRHGRLSATGDDGRGAAIFNRGALTLTTRIIGTLVISNTSEDRGGGAIASTAGTTVLEGVSFIDNTAALTGGAVDISGGSITLRSVSFEGNQAASGGAVALSGAASEIDAVSFTGNTASVSGGGAYLSANDALLSNVSFSSNTGGSGGGLYSDASDMTLANVTFGGNVATSGGRAVTAGGDTLLTVVNSVLWNDSAGAGAEIAYLATAGGVISNTLVMDSNGSGPGWDTSLGADGGGNIDDDPLFVRDPDPGLDGAWDGVDDDYGDLQLQHGSPAVDSGDNNLVPAGMTMDLAGRRRIVSGAVDMGAYETSEPRFYVNASSGAGPDCSDAGISWDTAFPQLFCALPAASPGAEIWVAQGIYKPTLGSDRLLTFQLASGVAVYGGFVGSETRLEQRNWESNVTVLSGDLAGDDSAPFVGNGENSYHVVSGTGTDHTAVLDGFHIRSGNANGPYPYHDIGGGLVNGDGVRLGGSPTLRNLAITFNFAYVGGGIGNQDDSDPAIVNTLVMSNAAVDGGGIYNSQADDPTMTNVTIVGNQASGYGGGVLNFAGSSPIFQNAIIAQNAASEGGSQVSSSDWRKPLFRYSLIEGSGGSGISWRFELGVDGGGNIDADPLFVCAFPAAPATFPAAPATLASSVDTTCLNHRLQSGSPAIDAGDSDADTDANRPLTQTLPLLDLGHQPRLVERSNPDTGIGGPPVVDMGAYESQIEAPTADFSAAPTRGEAPLIVQFSNLSSGDITSCSWDFGDGSDSVVCEGPEHEYAVEGTYTVTLAVSGPAGQDSLTKAHYILVDDLDYMYVPIVLNLP